MAEGLRRLLGGTRPAEVLGSDKVNAIAKAVATTKVGAGTDGRMRMGMEMWMWMWIWMKMGFTSTVN